MIEVPVSVGELCDRLAILHIKARRIPDPARRAAAEDLGRALAERWTASGLPPRDTLPEWEALVAVNERLWEVEDALRAHEAAGTFGEAFVALARSVYRLNDERAALKARVDHARGGVGEPKWYGGAPPAGSPEVTSDRTSRGRR